MPTLREIGEVEAIRRLAAARGADDRAVRVGPGDDGAVLVPEPGRELVATADDFVEGEHWLPEWIEPQALGARLGAANLSDIAAMAARPRWALLTIAVPAETDFAWLLAVQQGLAGALAAHGAAIVGGNLVASARPLLHLTLIGDAAPGTAWLRRGARPGDRLAVTGFPGRSAAGLALVRALGEGARAAEFRPLLAAWLAPRARVAEAQSLARAGGVRAAIDISDGFAGDLAQLARASAVGAQIRAGDWPADAPLERAAKALATSVEALRLAPGDDYELLLAVDPAKAEELARAAADAALPLAFVGEVTAQPGVLEWVAADGSQHPIASRGWDPFTR